MSSLQLGLPKMSVCVDEAWRNDLPSAIDDFGRRRFDVVPNFRNFVAFDEEICFDRGDMVGGVVDEEGSPLQQKGCIIGHGGTVEGSRQSIPTSALYICPSHTRSSAPRTLTPHLGSHPAKIRIKCRLRRQPPSAKCPSLTFRGES